MRYVSKPFYRRLWPLNPETPSHSNGFVVRALKVQNKRRKFWGHLFLSWTWSG